MTSSEEVDQTASKYLSPLHWFIAQRRRLRRRVNSKEPFDRGLHLYSSLILLLNIFFILYAMISLTSRMMLNGVSFIDSLPLAFYILPLLIFLPKLLLDYYRSRSAILTIIILLIVAFIFGTISALVRGFTILVVLNIVSIVIVFILGKFRPTAPLRSIGRKGVVWFLILNSLGLMLPVSVYVLGQVPIARATFSDSTAIFLEMPLASFDYQYVNITPTADILDDLQSSGFGVDLRVSLLDTHSLDAFSSWIVALSNTTIPYRITISLNRQDYRSFDETLLGSSHLLAEHYAHMVVALHSILTELDSQAISSDNLRVYLDMRISEYEWSHLMNLTKSIDLVGFSDIVRRSLDSTPSGDLLSYIGYFTDLIEDTTIGVNLVVEGFVIDDLIDGDATMMKFCGVSPEVITNLDANLEVACERSRYSETMDGDVGEYLVHTYSVSPYVNSMRIGVAGTSTTLEPIQLPVYQSIDELVRDIARASGNGIQEIVVSSLPSILHSFGSSAITELYTAVHLQESVATTYTFRIFALRAVVMAIDSFDFLMY